MNLKSVAAADAVFSQENLSIGECRVCTQANMQSISVPHCNYLLQPFHFYDLAFLAKKLGKGRMYPVGMLYVCIRHHHVKLLNVHYSLFFECLW